MTVQYQKLLPYAALSLYNQKYYNKRPSNILCDQQHATPNLGLMFDMF